VTSCVYALATLGCAIAGNIETLWLFRAAGRLCRQRSVVAGAIIRDRRDPRHSA
jgi:hypothetical protein